MICTEVNEYTKTLTYDTRRPLPVGRYGVIMADPPWKYANWSDKKHGAAKAHYDTLSLAELAQLPVHDLAAPDCALLLWATGPKLNEALMLMAAWGFQFKTVAFVWVKKYHSGAPYMGLGFYSRSGSEFVLLGTKGKPKAQSHGVYQVVPATVGVHSEKPGEVATRVELLFNGPYLELFARKQRPGWTVWGDEVAK